MLTLHPQFIKDTNGNNSMVILPTNEFEKIIEELEEMEDIKLYEEAKKNDSGERIPFSDYLKNRKQKNA